MRLLISAVAILSVPIAAAAQESPQKVTTVEGIAEYRLANGARVLLFPDPSSSTVTVNMTVLVGSRNEGYGETGMAHLLEHMVFKGTPTFANVPKALRDHGAASFNGSTWLDRTNYYETMPATDENLEFGIQLEADRLVHSFVKREDLVSEMTVVRNEFEAGENSPVNILTQRMNAVAYEWHNYGKSTIGNRADIERVPIDRLQEFYRKYYQPDNVVLIVAGKFDEAKALDLIQKYFGTLPRPKRKLDPTYTEEPPQDGERSVVLRRVGKVAVAGAVYHIPAGRHPDYPAVEVLNDVLTEKPAGRLYKALVETKKASSVAGGTQGLFDAGTIEFIAQCEPAKLDDVRQTLLDVLEGLAKEPVTAEEVERAKTTLLRKRKQLFDKSESVAIDLSEWACQGDWRLFFLHRDRLEQVTADDVNRVAAAYLQTTNRTLGLYIPTDKTMRTAVPNAPSADALVKDYKGRASIATGEAFDPTPQNIEARVQRGQIGGVKTALLAKKTRGEAVNLQLVLRFGNEQSLRGQSQAARLLGTLMERGTKNHTRQQLKDELEKLESSLDISGETGSLTVTVQTKKQHVAAVLKLLGEVLREPTFPAAEFEIARTEYRERLEKSKTEPEQLAGREIQRRLYPYPADDPRYIPTADESLDRLKGLTRDQIEKLYREQLGATGELAVVGDFEPTALAAQFQGILKDWTAGVPYKRLAQPARPDVAGVKAVIRTPDKANAVYVAGLTFAVQDNDPDAAVLDLGNFVLGGGPLSSRLADRVRQKDGLSYGVGSSFQSSSKEPSASLSVFAICNPANLEKADKAIAEELDKFLKDGPTDKEVTEGTKAFLKAQQVARADDAQLTGMLADHLEADRTFAFDTEYEGRVAGLTPAAVKAAYQKHVAAKRLVVIWAGDLKEK